MIIGEGISKIYNKGKPNEFVALKNINITLRDAELLAITGESGAGKSTLLHILSGIEKAETGKVEIDTLQLSEMSDNELSHLRNTILGIVWQDFALLDNFTASENVMLPLYFSRNTYRERRFKVSEAIERVGITGLANKPVRYLSRGQKQRVAIARAIVNNPKYLFADEPTGALDSKTASDILDLFKSLNRQGMGIIIVTHNELVANICNKIIRLNDGEMISEQEAISHKVLKGAFNNEN